MTPPTVNAYYEPKLQRDRLPRRHPPAAVLRRRADDAVNYGGIGAVIGHEMTHGFDDEGRQYDAQGNLSGTGGRRRTRRRSASGPGASGTSSTATCDRDIHVNGKLTLGENIADLGGLTIAYGAYMRSLKGKEPPPIDGLTGPQRFFLGWAQVWATKERPEYAKLIVNTNPHPLGRFRAIGPPSNLQQFASAFSCKAGDPMVRADRCEIW